MMSEKDKHINQDVFSQKIKEKLEDYSMPVDKDIWLEIEKKMTPPKRKKVVPMWYWLSGAVAAAVLALLILVKPFDTTDNKDLISVKTSVISQQDTVSAQQTPDDIEQSKNDLTQLLMGTGHKQFKLSIAGVQKPIRSGLSLVGEDFSKNEEIQKETVTGTSKTKTEIVSEKTAEEIEERAIIKQETSSKEDEKDKKIDVLPDLNDYPEVVVPRKTRKKQPILLAMSMETSDGFNVQNVNDFSEAPMLLETSKAGSRSFVREDLAMKYNSVLNVSDFTEARHLPPLSVGLTVAMPLNKTFAVESGLVYTFLRSDFTKPGITSYKANLNLHYLGIPINLRAKLWKKPTWNIYFSAGGMVEKGLRSVYNQEIDNGYSIYNTNIVSEIEGLQWSLSSGLGIDVKVQKNLSLFAEPKLIYYLDNNQPCSVRTESPLYIGIGGGLRIEL